MNLHAFWLVKCSFCESIHPWNILWLVHSYSWDINEANVVCRQLGFPGALFADTGSYYGGDPIGFWLNDVVCSGTEANLGQCRHAGWGEGSCSFNQEAGVLCEQGGFIMQCYMYMYNRPVEKIHWKFFNVSWRVLCIVMRYLILQGWAEKFIGWLRSCATAIKLGMH